jgi:hypothetical protein
MVSKPAFGSLCGAATIYFMVATRYVCRIKRERLEQAARIR